MTLDKTQNKDQNYVYSHLKAFIQDDKRIWSFIWGIVSASILVVIGFYVSTAYILKPYTYPVVLYIVLTIFAGSVGLYFADFWKNNENSIALSFGFLLVLLISTIALFWNKALVDILLLLGFFFGFAFVMSGAVDNSQLIQVFFRKLLKKFSWYLFGLELTSSFEIPLFQKIINSKGLNAPNIILITIVGMAYIVFVVVVYKYINSQ